MGRVRPKDIFLWPFTFVRMQRCYHSTFHYNHQIKMSSLEESVQIAQETKEMALSPDYIQRHTQYIFDDYSVVPRGLSSLLGQHGADPLQGTLTD